MLIVDDDRTSRESVAWILEQEGYRVAIAADGEEALAVFFSFDPNLVVTDLDMPGLDGVELLGRVKDRSPGTPVLIFTADSTIDAQREARALGASDYLNKPLDVDDMLDRIARALVL